MKINIIAVGKLQKEFKALFDIYAKKIKFYANLNIIEIKEFNDKNIEIQKRKETELIINAIPKSSKVLLCSLQGDNFSSTDFSKKFDEDNLTFVIGGSHGVDENQFINKINFSKMTFPHQMFRVMLVEQIFRALSIKNGMKYHK